MTSIVTSILSSTLGLLWNIARDATAESLKDGDVTDAKIREIVVRELNDIKTKLDGLSHKDLRISYMFLEEGVHLLSDSLDKSKDEQKAELNKDEDDPADCVMPTTMPSCGDILSDALRLSQAIAKLKIVSNQSESAKDRFKYARIEATRAFCDEALSIQDRIFAAKLRVVSEMLECLDSPDTAITSGLLFVKQLHDLSAVREIFSVYLGGGVKSIFGKTERVENVKSIMMINYVLYRFVQKFSSKYYGEFNWPIIQLNDRTFNPILDWGEVSMQSSWGDELKQPHNIVEIDEKISDPHLSSVNSRGEIIVVYNNCVRIISKTGKTKSVLPLPDLPSQDKNGNEMKHEIRGVAVDEENVYLFVFYSKGNGCHVMLYVFDEHCNHVKHKSVLNFQPGLTSVRVSLAVNKNKDIVMIAEDSVYVCDATGQFKYKFSPICCPNSVDVSENNEIIIGLIDDTVEIYTEEGYFKTFIKLPAIYEVRGVAFHFGTSKIIILSQHEEKESLYLHCYSETDEQLTSTRLVKTAYFDLSHITSHPSGAAAVVTENAILYL